MLCAVDGGLGTDDEGFRHVQEIGYAGSLYDVVENESGGRGIMGEKIAVA